MRQAARVRAGPTMDFERRQLAPSKSRRAADVVRGSSFRVKEEASLIGRDTSFVMGSPL